MSPAQRNVSQAYSTVISDGNTADENIQRQTVFPSVINVTSHSGMSENVFVSAYNRPITAALKRCSDTPGDPSSVVIFPTRSSPIWACSSACGSAICLHGQPRKFLYALPTRSSRVPGLRGRPFVPVCRALQSLRGRDLSDAFRVSVAEPFRLTRGLRLFCLFFFIDLQWFRWGIFGAGPYQRLFSWCLSWASLSMQRSLPSFHLKTQCSWEPASTWPQAEPPLPSIAVQPWKSVSICSSHQHHFQLESGFVFWVSWQGW